MCVCKKNNNLTPTGAANLDVPALLSLLGTAQRYSRKMAWCMAEIFSIHCQSIFCPSRHRAFCFFYYNTCNFLRLQKFKFNSIFRSFFSQLFFIVFSVREISSVNCERTCSTWLLLQRNFYLNYTKNAFQLNSLVWLCQVRYLFRGRKLDIQPNENVYFFMRIFGEKFLLLGDFSEEGSKIVNT